ncbi:PREDICTED: SKP1-like protein 13 [Prunus mume]|uniref:SKP1-like protein n=1 Tax=Prunus mume TaxID=102107 RepID=A0ABM0P2G6_PRUMU|nr:PREDICTED: SKP1-like protein 13 [Prunus mume]
MSSSSASKSRVVRLRSANNEIFEVEEAIVALSEPIKNLIDVIGVNHVIPMPDVRSKTLAMVIEWCKYHAASDQGPRRNTKELIKEWEEELDQADVVIDLLCTASFLCIKDLQDQMFQRVADLIKVKTLEEICELFTVKNDFSS